MSPESKCRPKRHEGESAVQTTAVILSGAERARAWKPWRWSTPGAEDLVVEVAHSGISTGTEKLFWSGTMPPFPGMGYPLVPGYEAAGEVVEAGADTGFRVGERVFVPGANCFDRRRAGPVRRRRRGIWSPRPPAWRGSTPALGAEGALLALAATARHALAGFDTALPDLIVGPRHAGPAAGAADRRRRRACADRLGDRPDRRDGRHGLRGDRTPKTIRAATTARSTTPRARGPAGPAGRPHRQGRRGRAGRVLHRARRLRLPARLHEGGAPPHRRRMGAGRPDRHPGADRKRARCRWTA